MTPFQLWLIRRNFVWLDLNYGERVSFVVSLESKTRHRILSSWLVSEIRAGAQLLEINFNLTWGPIYFKGTLLKIFFMFNESTFVENLLLQRKARRKFNYLFLNDICTNSVFNSTMSLQCIFSNENVFWFNFQGLIRFT